MGWRCLWIAKESLTPLAQAYIWLPSPPHLGSGYFRDGRLPASLQLEDGSAGAWQTVPSITVFSYYLHTALGLTWIIAPEGQSTLHVAIVGVHACGFLFGIAPGLCHRSSMQARLAKRGGLVWRLLALVTYRPVLRSSRTPAPRLLALQTQNPGGNASHSPTWRGGIRISIIITIKIIRIIL